MSSICRVYNTTDYPVAVVDHYVTDASMDLGYKGTLSYPIRARGHADVSASALVRRWLRELKAQQVHVVGSDSGQPLKRWEHDEFLAFVGKEVYLEMGDDGHLHARIEVGNHDQNPPWWIWYTVPFLASSLPPPS